MDEREAFQRMRRLQLGSDQPTYANLGRYYEPFEERVAPISPEALESAFQPIPPRMQFELEEPMDIEEDVSPVQTIHLSQVIRSGTPSPGRGMDSRAQPVVGSEGFGSIDRAETGDHAEETEDADGSTEENTDEDDEYVAPGPSKLTHNAPGQAVPYSLGRVIPRRGSMPRVTTEEQDFPHPAIPNPGTAHEQAIYSTGKQQWWRHRVLQPLLSASPRPLSKETILSIIKTDLGLEGDAWDAFHDAHLVGTYISALIPLIIYLVFYLRMPYRKRSQLAQRSVDQSQPSLCASGAITSSKADGGARVSEISVI